MVTTLMATDADLDPAFRLMEFAIESGDKEGIFALDWEPDSGHVQLKLHKVRVWTDRKGANIHIHAQVCHPLTHTVIQILLVLEPQL